MAKVCLKLKLSRCVHCWLKISLIHQPSHRNKKGMFLQMPIVWSLYIFINMSIHSDSMEPLWDYFKQIVLVAAKQDIFKETSGYFSYFINNFFFHNPNWMVSMPKLNQTLNTVLYHSSDTWNLKKQKLNMRTWESLGVRTFMLAITLPTIQEF